MLVAFSTSCGSPEPPEKEDLGYGLPINAYELEGAELERALDLAEEAGVDSISTGAVWWHIAPGPSPGSYRWEGLNRLVAETEERGLGLNVQISGTPDWVHPWLIEQVPDPVRRRWYPPRGPKGIGHFKGFVRTLVEKYGTRVDRYEIWNEPNLKQYWEPHPNPEEYAVLLRAAYTTIKQTEPEVTVVSGGLARNHVGFLDAYYDSARRYNDAAENDHFFDVLGLHPYTRGPNGVPYAPDWSGPSVIQTEYGPLDYSFAGIAKIKATMERNGDPEKPIYIGEFGYTTLDDELANVRGIPDTKRSLYLKRAYALARDLPYVEEMVWYAYLPPADNAGWSIVGPNLNPSLTFRALEQTTGSGEGPTVTLKPPREPISGTSNLEVELSDRSQEDVSMWEVYVNGVLAEVHGGVPVSWDASDDASGEHELMVVVYTKDGSVWPSNVVSATVESSSVGIGERT